jgi:hypothetical protein
MFAETTLESALLAPVQFNFVAGLIRDSSDCAQAIRPEPERWKSRDRRMD